MRQAWGCPNRTPMCAATALRTVCPTGRPRAFVEEYPEVKPEDIPQQVWEWAQQEGSLVSAYRKWEILELKDELAALEVNQKNRRAAVGPAQSDGEPAGVDPVTLALLGK